MMALYLGVKDFVDKKALLSPTTLQHIHQKYSEIL